MLLIGVGVLTCYAYHSESGVSDAPDGTKKLSVAYIQDKGNTLPAPDLYDALIYAFAEFNDNNDGLVLPHPERIRAIADLKLQNPSLKVILGVGGEKYEGFSEMGADAKKRKQFAKSCKQIIDSLNLDGVDLDWEFPGTTAGGHSAGPDDVENYILIVKQLRKTLGKKSWISFYSNNSGGFIDLKGMVPYVTYVNVSGYNLATAKDGKLKAHQSNLYSSDRYGDWSVDKAVARHIKLGVPRNKILLGIPFYAWADKAHNTFMYDYSIPVKFKGESEKWDDKALVPYYDDNDGTLTGSFDNTRSIAIKGDYIRKKGLAGGFIFPYEADYPDQRLSKALRESLKPHPTN